MGIDVEMGDEIKVTFFKLSFKKVFTSIAFAFKLSSLGTRLDIAT